jgi:hypothetical protein
MNEGTIDWVFNWLWWLSLVEIMIEASWCFWECHRNSFSLVVLENLSKYSQIYPRLLSGAEVSGEWASHCHTWWRGWSHTFCDSEGYDHSFLVVFYLVLLEFDMASLNCCGIFTAISYIYELIEATELWMRCMGSLEDQWAVQPSLYWVSGIPLILHLVSSVKKLGKNFENCSGVLL